MKHRLIRNLCAEVRTFFCNYLKQWELAVQNRQTEIRLPNYIKAVTSLREKKVSSRTFGFFGLDTARPFS